MLSPSRDLFAFRGNASLALVLKNFQGGDAVSDFGNLFFNTPEDKELQGCFKEKFQAAKLLLCDEFALQERLLRFLQDDQHCVVFTSAKHNKPSLPRTFQNPNWTSFKLSFSLRSTGAIANFADGWIKRNNLSRINFSCEPAHNFEGESNDIVFAKNHNFVSRSVSLISHYYERVSGGFQVLPVICFMSQETRSKILTAVLKTIFNCDPGEPFGLLLEQGKPLVKFYEPSELEGLEFVAVIILINFKHVKEIGRQFEFEFLTAITRALKKTVIIMNQDQLGECRENDYKEIGSCCQYDVYKSYFDEIRIIRYVNTRYLLIGPNKPTVEDFVESQHQPIPEMNNVHLYVARNGGASFLYCQDVYKQSHLDKLYEGGIREIVILDDNFCWPFYRHTIVMIDSYSEKRNDAFNVRLPHASGRQSANELVSLLEYCQGVCKNPPTLANFREKWSTKEAKPNWEYFSWRQWKEKASEAYKLRKKFLALNLYQCSQSILQDEYIALLLKEDVLLAAENKTERAKLLTNSALVLIDATKFEVEYDESVLRQLLVFRDEEVFPYETPISMIRAIGLSLQGVIVNACWNRNYERLNKAMTELKKYFKSELQKMEIMHSESSRDAEMKKMIDREKENKCIVELWESKCDYYPATSTIEGFFAFYPPATRHFEPLFECFPSKYTKNLIQGFFICATSVSLRLKFFT